jgi:stress response protein YsnF
VQKRAVQDTQQVSDTVRREEVRVENEGNVKVTDKNSLTDKTTGKKKPAA